MGESTPASAPIGNARSCPPFGSPPSLALRWGLRGTRCTSVSNSPPDGVRRPAADNAEAQARLREIDTFENTWFPRVRAIIERVVPDEHVDQFLTVFFKDLTQQPLGPTVLLSVTTLLQRIAELDHSKLPGADKVAATLRARNLTPGKIAHIKALIAELQTPAERTNAPTPRSTLKARTDVAREQRAGYVELVKWYNDWRTTLTPLFVGTDAVALGFARQKGGPRAAEDEDDEETVGEKKPT